jgi:uncharacterized Zn finger protein (UPF0148 family)
MSWQKLLNNLTRSGKKLFRDHCPYCKLEVPLEVSDQGLVRCFKCVKIIEQK